MEYTRKDVTRYVVLTDGRDVLVKGPFLPHVARLLARELLTVAERRNEAILVEVLRDNV